MSRGCMLENARVVHHDSVTAASLSFGDGRVVGPGPSAFRIDLSNHFVYPGLINAHDHLHLNNIPRVPHDAPFANSYEWMAAVEVHRRRPDVLEAVAVPLAARYWQGGLKNLLSGVTTVVHHDPWHEVFDQPGFPVSVARHVAWCHSLGLGGGSTPRYGPAVAQSFAAARGAVPWVIHLAEGTDDDAKSELRELDALGCLAGNTVLVHGVGLRDADIDRIIDCGASVVWCPASNVELFGRTLDPARLFHASRLSLGTDSRLTGARDMLDEIRVASTHGQLTPSELLRTVTAAPSDSLLLRGAGALSLGMRADCVILRAGGDDPWQALIEARRADIRAVIRDGLPVIADPDFAGWFAAAGVDVVSVTVDGRLKLLAASVAREAALLLEPGVALGA